MSVLDAEFKRGELERLAANWPALDEFYNRHARISLARQHFEHWECYALSCLSRIHYSVASVFLLRDREADAASLTRILYEHVVAFAWLMIDPEQHYKRLLSWEKNERTKMVKGLAKFNADPVTEAEATMHLVSVGLDPTVPAAPETFDRADQAERFWAAGAAAWTFSFPRSYASLFRPYSAFVHPTVAGLISFFDPTPGADPASPIPRHQGCIPAEAMMLFIDALVVSAARLGWPLHDDILAVAFYGFTEDS